MPYVNIQVTDEGVTTEQKTVLIERTTALLQEVLDKDPATTHVVISEVSLDNWGVRGVPVRALRAEQD